MNVNVDLILSIFNERVGEEKFSDFDELLEFLSNEFANEYENCDDAQKAYNNVNDKYDGLLGEYFVYTLGTESWRITTQEGAELNDLLEAIELWNNYYGSDVKDIEDFCSELENRIYKDMSNAGCDVFNALTMIADDVGFDKDLILIDLGELDPKIELLEF